MYFEHNPADPSIESECDMAKCFMSRLIYLAKQNKLEKW